MDLITLLYMHVRVHVYMKHLRPYISDLHYVSSRHSDVNMLGCVDCTV